VAFVLTYCQRRPHDRHYFQFPDKIICGPIRPPQIDLANTKILARHCNAEVLAEYWAWLDRRTVGGRSEAFRMSGTVGAFFDDRLDGTNMTPHEHLRNWLAEPGPHQAYLDRLREAFGLQSDRAEQHLHLIADSNEGANPSARAAEDARSLLNSFRDSMDRHREEADLHRQEASQLRKQDDHATASEVERTEQHENQSVRSFGILERQLRGEFLISFLMSRGVLPSFAFPVNVGTLHVLAEEMREDRKDNSPSLLKFERDMKIALGEYAPGAEVVAGKRVYRSVGLRKFPVQEFDGTNWFRTCPACNGIELWEHTEQPTQCNPECKYCGQMLPQSHRQPLQWVEPRWGFVTDVSKRAERPQGQRPWRIPTARAFFIGGRPSLEEKEVAGSASPTAETIPDPHGESFVEGRYASGRSLLVLNLGEFAETKEGVRHRRGFQLCSRCGRAEFEEKRPDRGHRAPYHRRGSACKGPIGVGPRAQGRPVALGHRYETDVVWLEFQGASQPARPEGCTGHAGFWLSLAYALTNAAADELNIERNDLEATTVPLEAENRQAIVLYDAVPGGAGHCRRVLRELPAVIRRARDRLAECDCEPTATGCYGCLCDYQNQFAHDLLSRGPALAYLNALVDEIDRGEPSPWRRPSTSPCREIADWLRETQGQLLLVARSIEPSVIRGMNRAWFDILDEVALRPSGPSSVTLILGELPEPGSDPARTLAYHRLAGLQARGVSLQRCTGPEPQFGSLRMSSVESPCEGVWCWDWSSPLSPTIDGVRRARLGREIDALDNLGPKPQCQPATLDALKEFHHFVLQPGIQQDPWDSGYLAKILRNPIRQLLLIDPHILCDREKRNILSRFLERVRTAPGIEVRVKAGRSQSRDEFSDWKVQDRERKALEARHTALKLSIYIPDRAPLDEHDRPLMVRLADGRCYRALLGNGLFGFEAVSRKRSEGVLFEISDRGFQEEWNRFRTPPPTSRTPGPPPRRR
jgi:hypothetical protein